MSADLLAFQYRIHVPQTKGAGLSGKLPKQIRVAYSVRFPHLRRYSYSPRGIVKAECSLWVRMLPVSTQPPAVKRKR